MSRIWMRSPHSERVPGSSEGSYHSKASLRMSVQPGPSAPLSAGLCCPLWSQWDKVEQRKRRLKRESDE